MSQSGSDSAQSGAESVVDTEEQPPARAQTPDAHAEEPSPRVERPWWQRRYTFTGTAVGLLFLWLSMTPSLLPRGPLFQGLVSGASGAIGYALGVFSVWLVRFMRSKDTSPPAPRIAWTVLVSVGGVGTVLMIVWFHIWQDDVRDLVGVPHLKWHDYPVAALLAIVVLFALVEIGQLIRGLVLFLVRRLNHVVPPRVSAVIAVLVVVAVIVGILNGVVLRLTMRTLNNTFETVNNEESPTTPPPTTMLRSGGPGSLVSWASLGHQGRIFVDGATSTQQLSAFNGAPALEPIRAYAGLESANDIQAAAELAAGELQRTGGLTRKVVAVATTTGTGWINEAEADAVEYMYNGDTAIVSMQYSFLPSWLSFLVDKENARHAGQVLFEAVAARIHTLPEGARPKLVVFGESLGSFGGEAPFLSANNIVARTDGALFSGPTFNNTMWDNITRSRDSGSPEWLPIYQQGSNVRFSARAADLGRPDDPWGKPRIVYVQHASDPIAWWNTGLLFRKPDWLREKRGYDVLPSVEWIPFVTFLQVSADMAVAVDVPDGHGHRYVKDIANAWAAILQPPGWTADKTDRLRLLLHAND
jgi:uncharacterized membrane protein